MHLKSCWSSLSHLPQNQPHPLLVSPLGQEGHQRALAYGATSRLGGSPSSLIDSCWLSLNHLLWWVLTGQAGSEVSLLGLGARARGGVGNLEASNAWQGGAMQPTTYFCFSSVAQATKKDKRSLLLTLPAPARKKAGKAVSI